MNNKNTFQGSQDDVYFQIIRLVEANPDMTQRELASKLGISLGKVNYCMNALLTKGWIKVQNFSINPKKIGYLYILTPAGLKEKAQQTGNFLRRKVQEYKLLKAEIGKLTTEMEALDQENMKIL